MDIDITEWGNRWLKENNKHNYCELTKESVAWLNGELLGDGSLYSQTLVSARFEHASKYLEYIKYVIKTLEGFGIQQSGKIREHISKGSLCYYYKSRMYTELYSLQKSWYPEPTCKKVVPRDIILTSITCRQWYIGDGCLHHSHKQLPYITLSTNAFPIDDVKWLIKQLWEIGVLATRRPSDNTIGIAAYSTRDFLNYIGECPVECYKYKWKEVEEQGKKLSEQQLLKL